MKTILIAEDETSMLSFMARSFEKRGYQVTACENGALAYGHLQNKTYDLLLTDIVMPEMDGIELSSKAKKLYPDMKIMYVTGFAGLAEDKKKQEDDSTTISKPFHLNELVDRVDALLKE